jgi:hypothetical protein
MPTNEELLAIVTKLTEQVTKLTEHQATFKPQPVGDLTGIGPGMSDADYTAVGKQIREVLRQQRIANGSLSPDA